MSLDENKLLSATDLMVYRNKRDKTLPKRDCKNLPESSSTNFLQELNEILNEKRVHKSGDMSVAVYNVEDGSIELIKDKGKFWQVMGYVLKSKKYLYPEETIFLMETGQLELMNGDASMSIQEAYQVLLTENCTLEQYQTYTHLCRMGYTVVRHQGRLCKNSQLKFNSEDQFLTQKRMHDEDEEFQSSQKKFKSNEDNFGNSRVDFPNFISKHEMKLNIPPSDLLPRNITITPEMCLVNAHKIRDNKRPLDVIHQFSYKRRNLSENYPKLFPSGIYAQSWGEFKEKIQKLDSASKANFIKAVKPLEKINIEEISSKLRIIYDVYLPLDKFKKNGILLPNHRVVIRNVHDLPPTLHELSQLNLQDGIPINFSIVDEGQVVFYSFNSVSIPSLISK